MSVCASESDCGSYMETSDSEDQVVNESEFSVHALGILSSLDESIGKIDDFLAYDRGFLPGDIVSSISNPSGQLGRVVDIDMTVDLETYCGYPIKDINSKKLLRMKSFVPGDYVICGPWLGKVMKAYDVVTILFDDGASCTIMTGEENLTPVFPSQTEDSPLTFYPGQHVRVKLPTFSKSVRWLCGSWKDYRDTGIVSNVEVGSVCVNWVACVQGDISSTPSSIKDPQDLTLLSCFPHTSWQLGDWCRIISDNLHSPMMLSGNSSPTVAPLNFNQMEQLGGDDISCMRLCVIVKRKARVNVQWQNGSYLNGLDSQSLCPVNTIGDHEFWPGQFVLEKVAPGDLCALSRGRLGVVHSVNARERTVNVKWKVTDGETTKHKFFEETASAYELIEHPDFSYFFGDVVLRLLPHMESVEERLIEDESSTWNWTEDASFKEFGSPLACQKDISKWKNTNGYLSCIGNVIGFKYEGIEVRWASGHVSLVHPSEIFVLDKLNEPTMLIEENSSENVIKEGATQDRTSLLKEKSLNNLDGVDEKDRQDSAELFSHYIVRCFRNIATSLFGQHGSTSLSCQMKGFSKLQILKTSEKELDLEDLPLENHGLRLEDAVNEQPKYLLGNENPIKFKQFDIVFDCSDHHFVNGFDRGLISYQVKSGWLKKVQQEWATLKSNLPDGIYVRAYEERIDLLRVCIAGSAGTPYHDGLFLFDFFIPSEYPHEPPVAHYISGGLKLNPNLYESGKVCLSLLKTWMGTGTETWNPMSSTILQVLLSLQALVLNDKPYFNEAGYDGQIGKAEGVKNSVTYNENAFLLSCKSMMYLIRKPPKHFEELIGEHFAWRSVHILRACKAYMNGAHVGFALEQGEALEGSSAGFMIMLEKLFPKLIEAFTEKGINCSQFLN